MLGMGTDKFRGPPVTSTNGGNPAAGRYGSGRGNRQGRLRSIALPAPLVNSGTGLVIPHAARRPGAATAPAGADDRGNGCG